MPRYFLYGLTVDSALPLPECPPCTQPAAAVDVQIRFDAVPEQGFGLPGRFLQLQASKAWHNTPVARFLVSDGRDIAIELLPDADPETLRLYVLGVVFGSLLLQRGSVVLHGNAIAIDGQCLVCVGDSGAGKSTLAAAFMQAGFRSLSDDVVVVDEDGQAVPAFPRLRLHGDALDGLGLNRDDMAKIAYYPDKYAVPAASHFCPERLPIRWVVVLGPAQAQEAMLWQAIEGPQRLPIFKRYCFQLRQARAMGFSPMHFFTSTRLAGSVQMWQVHRPAQGFSAEAMRDEILAKIGHLALSAPDARWSA